MAPEPVNVEDAWLEAVAQVPDAATGSEQEPCLRRGASSTAGSPSSSVRFRLYHQSIAATVHPVRALAESASQFSLPA
jgi:hypothetical protein